jgi:transposase
MTHLIGHHRAQTLLLPESLDDYVGPGNPVRFVEAFVDGLDLAAAGFGRVRPKETGRPGYAPSDLLKLYIYGYLNRDPVQPKAGSRDAPQCRGDLAVAAPEAGLQGDCRFPP